MERQIKIRVDTRDIWSGLFNLNLCNGSIQNIDLSFYTNESLATIYDLVKKELLRRYNGDAHNKVYWDNIIESQMVLKYHYQPVNQLTTLGSFVDPRELMDNYVAFGMHFEPGLNIKCLVLTLDNVRHQFVVNGSSPFKKLIKFIQKSVSYEENIRQRFYFNNKKIVSNQLIQDILSSYVIGEISLEESCDHSVDKRIAVWSMNGFHYQRLYTIQLALTSMNANDVFKISEEGHDSEDIEITRSCGRYMYQIKYPDTEENESITINPATIKTKIKKSGIIKVFEAHIKNPPNIIEIHLIVHGGKYVGTIDFLKSDPELFRQFLIMIYCNSEPNFKTKIKINNASSESEIKEQFNIRHDEINAFGTKCDNEYIKFLLTPQSIDYLKKIKFDTGLASDLLINEIKRLIVEKKGSSWLYENHPVMSDIMMSVIYMRLMTLMFQHLNEHINFLELFNKIDFDFKSYHLDQYLDDVSLYEQYSQSKEKVLNGCIKNIIMLMMTGQLPSNFGIKDFGDLFKKLIKLGVDYVHLRPEINSTIYSLIMMKANQLDDYDEQKELIDQLHHLMKRTKKPKYQWGLVYTSHAMSKIIIFLNKTYLDI